MEITIAEPKAIRSLTLPMKEVRVAVIGDIQYDGPDGAVDLDRLERHIKWCVQHDCYFVGTGDYVDFLSPSNRARLKAAALYDTASDIIDQKAKQLENEVFEILKPTRGRWLGLVQGHHYHEYSDGTTTDTSLASRLGSPFLGDAGIVSLKLKDRFNHTQYAHLYVWHGQGGGSTKGGLDGIFRRLALGISADVYVMGHFTQRGAWPEQRLYVDHRGNKEPRLDYRPYWCVLGGGWMLGYKHGHKFAGRPQGTYVEQRGLRPVQLGGPIIYLRPKYTHRGAPRLDINVSP